MKLIDTIKDIYKAYQSRNKPNRQRVMSNSWSSSFFWSWQNNRQSSTSLKDLQVWMNIDWSLRVWLHTFFALVKKNYMIQSSINLLSERIGWNGIYFSDAKGKTIDISSIPTNVKDNIYRFFSIPNLKTYIQKTISYIVISWQCVSTGTELNNRWMATKETKVNLLDPRMLIIKSDDVTGKLLSYDYYNKNKAVTLIPELVVDTLVYPDLDRDNYWQSQMESIVIDALTDNTMWSREFHFYRNNATPSTVYVLHPDAQTTDVDQLEQKIREKFWWNANNWQPIISNVVQDVKTIEIPDIKVVEGREFILKIVSTVFWIDPRVLWFMKDTWWSYAEIDSISRNITNQKLESWTAIIEEAMNKQYTKYFGEIPYRIRLDTILFKNTNLDKEMSLKELEKWIINKTQYKELYNL